MYQLVLPYDYFLRPPYQCSTQILFCMFNAQLLNPCSSIFEELQKHGWIGLVKPHGKRTWLNVPEWLREEWRTGSKDQIADVLRDSNFNKDTVEFWLYFWNDPPNSQV